MKKLVKKLVILLISLFTLNGWCQSGAVISGAVLSGAGASAAAGCTTANDLAIFDDSAASGSTDSFNNKIVGRQFVFTGTKTITRYKVNITDSNQAGNTTFGLYTDNAGALGNLVAGSDVSLAHTSIPDTETVLEVDLPVPLTGLTAGTYWLTVKADINASIRTEYKSSTGIRSKTVAGGYMDNYTLVMGVWGCTE